MSCFSLYRSSTRKVKCYASSLLDNWLMFDDDKVMPVSGEDVLKLSGGGEFLALFPGNKIRQSNMPKKWLTTAMIVAALKVHYILCDCFCSFESLLQVCITHICRWLACSICASLCTKSSWGRSRKLGTSPESAPKLLAEAKLWWGRSTLVICLHWCIITVLYIGYAVIKVCCHNFEKIPSWQVWICFYVQEGKGMCEFHAVSTVGPLACFYLNML